MINDYWEELNSKQLHKNFSEIHEHLLEEMELPVWLSNICCPFCNKKQPLSSIRSFGLKLNPRNMGDLFIEVACVDCKKMDTLYYPKEISTIKDFIDIISQKTLIKNKPIVEENMYKLQYNNMVEKALEKIGCVKNKSIKVFSNNGEVHADNTGDK